MFIFGGLKTVLFHRVLLADAVFIHFQAVSKTLVAWLVWLFLVEQLGNFQHGLCQIMRGLCLVHATNHFRATVTFSCRLKQTLSHDKYIREVNNRGISIEQTSCHLPWLLSPSHYLHIFTL